MTPSPRQLEIYKAFKETDKHICVQATAGSGKSTTLLELLKFVPRFRKAIFLSFSNGIVSELKERVPVGIQASTLHSLGCRAIMKCYHGTKVEENKYFLKALFTYYSNKETRDKDAYKECFRLQDICNFARMTYADFNEESLAQMCEYYGLDFSLDTLNKAVDLLTTPYGSKVIDFTDMIYLPLKDKNITIDKFDYVFLDEAQDLNNCQRLFVEKLLAPKGRLISVGDKHQCQPIGTKVLLRDGTSTNIENLNIGDVVVTYSPGTIGGYTNYAPKNKSLSIPKTGGVIQEKVIRDYEGELLTIETPSNSSTYTPEHKCCFKIIDNLELIQNKFVVYLMQNEKGYFRIGYTKFWYSSKSTGFGLSYRCMGEKATKGWILQIFDSSSEAYIYESLYSYKFGIPKLCFIDHQTEGSNLTKKTNIDKFWGLIDLEENQKRANQCLQYFNRNINYPLYQHNCINEKKNLRVSKHLMFYTQACNLIPELMQVNVFNPKNRLIHSWGEGSVKAQWESIKVIKREIVKTKVVSLKVSGTELYVADNILTHNSIYSFAGSSIDSFEKLQKKENTIVLPLDVSYRCPKAVVRQAQKVCTTINYFEDSIEGEVRSGDIDEIKAGDLVICRNTRPLIALYFHLLENDIRCKVVGKDIETGLLQLATRCKSYTREIFVKNLNKELQTLVDELKDMGVKIATDHPRYIALVEKIQVLTVISRKLEPGEDIIQKIKFIFSDDIDAAKLMTLHRSKGLENKRVFIVERFNKERLLPSKHATKDWEMIQENNLAFVAYTRAKESLIFLNFDE